MAESIAVNPIEKIPTQVFETPLDASKHVAQEIAKLIKERAAQGKWVLPLAQPQLSFTTSSFVSTKKKVSLSRTSSPSTSTNTSPWNPTVSNLTTDL